MIISLDNLADIKNPIPVHLIPGINNFHSYLTRADKYGPDLQQQPLRLFQSRIQCPFKANLVPVIPLILVALKKMCLFIPF